LNTVMNTIAIPTRQVNYIKIRLVTIKNEINVVFLQNNRMSKLTKWSQL